MNVTYVVVVRVPPPPPERRSMRDTLQVVVVFAWLYAMLAALVVVAGYQWGVQAQAQCPTRITGGGTLVEQRVDDRFKSVACKWTLLYKEGT